MCLCLDQVFASSFVYLILLLMGLNKYLSLGGEVMWFEYVTKERYDKGCRNEMTYLIILILGNNQMVLIFN